jgi:site-specific DNA recombinase
MIHAWTRAHGRIYRYYACSAAQKRGQATCPAKRIPAGRVEEFVVDKIRAIGADPGLQRETFRQALAQVTAQRRALKAEEKRLRDETPRVRAEVDRLVHAVAAADGRAEEALLDRLGTTQERLVALEVRQREIRVQVEELAGLQVDEADLAKTLQSFTPIWDVLQVSERERILRLLIDSINYDGRTESLTFAFKLDGLGVLAAETSAGRS